MKAILEFDLPDDKESFDLHNKVDGLYDTVHAIDDLLRSKLKYGHNYESATEALLGIRNELRILLQENKIDLD